MMRAAAEALAASKRPGPRPEPLGETILPDGSGGSSGRSGSRSPQNRVLSLARPAKRAGLDGVVASPQEVRQIRRACGRNSRRSFRACGRSSGKTPRRRRDDQARGHTGGRNSRRGGDRLVGRPIDRRARLALPLRRSSRTSPWRWAIRSCCGVWAAGIRTGGGLCTRSHPRLRASVRWTRDGLCYIL